ncbi:MAG TPA: GNAT family N-acetyltransferase [Phycisphaerae bacterium]|nr:GNAT family N-acetyltransferase [Phycisphaerae bacterium]HNU45220.1 GNAT family N-acetyltransferase [Phycisphaerae bacterium]
MSNAQTSDEVRIRPARTEDYDAIVAVWQAVGLSFCQEGRESQEAFGRQLEHFHGLYLVAQHGRRVVGVVLGSHDQRKGWINRLAVLPAYRRQGIAQQLVRACEAALLAAGIEIFAALIEPENDASAALFERLGYRNDVPARYYRKRRRPDV